MSGNLGSNFIVRKTIFIKQNFLSRTEKAPRSSLSKRLKWYNQSYIRNTFLIGILILAVFYFLRKTFRKIAKHIFNDKLCITRFFSKKCLANISTNEIHIFRMFFHAIDNYADHTSGFSIFFTFGHNVEVLRKIGTTF